MTQWSKLRELVLKKIKPKPEEEIEIKNFSQKLLITINTVLETNNVKARAEVHGSVAHGTWLSGERDVDVFIILETNYDRRTLSSVLNLLRSNIEGEYVEAYAEHPYLKASIDGYQVDLVPCFEIEEGMSIISSTDRTPLHTMYLRDRLSKEMMDEVRLLKQFMKGVGVYGAEIKVGGFSGYLCELLILKYGSLIGLLKASSKWEKFEVIKLEPLNKEEETVKRFKDSLILLDPIDSTRNVASALTQSSFWNFVAAAQRFQDDPKLNYFFKAKIDSNPDAIKDLIHSRETDILFLIIEEAKAEVPDSLWGQLLKSRLALESLFSKNDFVVLRSSVWSNEESRHIFIFELESNSIPSVELHMGPPVNMKANSDSFIASHMNSDQTVAGPEIKDARWIVLRKRQINDAATLLRESLYDGGINIGVSSKLAVKILQHHRILQNNEISDYLVNDFCDHIHRFLIGRPDWIE